MRFDVARIAILDEGYKRRGGLIFIEKIFRDQFIGLLVAFAVFRFALISFALLCFDMLRFALAAQQTC